MSEENKLNIDLSTNTDQNKDSQQPAFQIPTEAAELVGNGKKYQSVEDALKSVPHAQKHIQTLESELAAAREELAKRKTAEELLDEIKSGIQPKGDTPSGEFDQDKLLEIVGQTIEYREQQKVARSNVDLVASKLTAQFGPQAEQVYKNLAKDNGLTEQQLNTLSATSPNAVLKLAGLAESKPTIPSKSSGDVNTQALKPTQNSAELSARVKPGSTTKDLVNAWRAAGEKVKQQNLTN